MKGKTPMAISVRSVTVADDGTAYALLRRGKELHVAGLVGESFEPLRAVGSKGWWLRVVGRSGGPRHVYVIDDGPPFDVMGYGLGDGARGRKVAAKILSWHRVATTCRTGVYVVAAKRILRLGADGTAVDLDAASDARSDEEAAASFFVATDVGLHRRRLTASPDAWERFYEANLHGCKQIAYDPAHQQVIAAVGAQHGVGYAHFVDADGKAKVHSSEAGFWSVATCGGRAFFYSFEGQGVIELDRDGTRKVHDVNGTISRNQCLTAGTEAVYFVCEDSIRVLRPSEHGWSSLTLPAL